MHKIRLYHPAAKSYGCNLTYMLCDKNKHVNYSLKFKKNRRSGQRCLWQAGSNWSSQIACTTLVSYPFTSVLPQQFSNPLLIWIDTTVATRVVKGLHWREKAISPNCAIFSLSASISDRKASASAPVATTGRVPASGTAQMAETSAATASSAAAARARRGAAVDEWEKHGRSARERRRTGRRSATAAREAMV